MKNQIRFLNIVLAAVVFSLIATVSYGGDSVKSSGAVIHSSEIVGTPVMKESTWEQWPNDAQTAGISGHVIHSQGIIGTTVMKESTWEQWPNYAESESNSGSSMAGSETVNFSFGIIGTSVMKESTWEAWPIYDESMTE